jgi:fibronectin type 3 domain-containing protein/tetratricopeptide (TPR) repeat protein
MNSRATFAKTIIAATAAALTFALLAPWPARAQAGREAIDQAKKLYQTGELDQALAAARDAVKQLMDNKTKADARLLLGMILDAQGEKAQASEEFAQAAALDPKRKLAVEYFPPNIIQAFEQAKLRKLGAVVIQTSPSEAEVYLDGEIVGISPVPLEDIVAGKHKVKIQRKDYRPKEKEIDVQAAERSEIYFELEILDEQPARIVHEPLKTAKEGSSLWIKAQISDNIGVVEANVFFRKTGAKEYEKLPMLQAKPGQYEAVAPKEKVAREGVEYYVTAQDMGGNLSYDGKPEEPYKVKVAELDKEPPSIFHQPAMATSDASKMTIKASIIDNKKVASARVYFKRGTEKTYLEEEMAQEGPAGNYTFVFPDVLMNAREIDYYVEAADDSGNTQFSGRADSPYKVSVVKVVPFKDGYIVERKMDREEPTRSVTVNIGALKGAAAGQIYNIFSADEKVVDPDTGAVLAINQRLTGKLKITRAEVASSQGEIVKEYGKNSVKKGDMIRARPSPPANVGGFSEKFRIITVTWKVNPEPEVAGYVVYRSENKDGPFEDMDKTYERDAVEVLDKGTRKAPLADGKKYYYRVRAFNGEKETSDFSETGFVIAKGGPNPPTGLTAVSGEIRQITLAWQKSGDPEAAGYKIHRAEAEEGPWTEVADLRPGDAKFQDKHKARGGAALEDGKTYWYKLVSYNSKGKPGNFTEPAPAASRVKPTAPANPRMVSSSVRSLTIAWDRSPDADVNRYMIYRSETAEGDFKLVKEIGDRSATEYTDEDKKGVEIKDSQAYFYKLAAMNVGGAESDPSAPINGITFGPPQPPVDIKALSGLVKQTVIAWTPPKDPKVMGYSVYRGDSPETLARIKKIMDPATAQFKDAGEWGAPLKDGAKYFYSVRSFNTAGVENSSPQILEMATKPSPSTPIGLAATADLAGRVKLTWTANPEGDIASYTVLRLSKSEGSYSAVASAKDASHEDKNLEHGKDYAYKIQAADKDGLKSQVSETVTGKTKPLPAAVAGVKASMGEAAVTLEWERNKEEDILRYDVYSTGLLGKEKVGSAAVAPAHVKGLKGGTYTFIVVAVDKDGLQSPPSAPVSLKIK